MQFRLRCVLLLIIIGMMASFSISASLISEKTPDSLTYYTEDLPPYNYVENGTAKGVTVDILENITKKSGIPFSRDSIHIIPWEEAYAAALEGNRTVLFATARTHDRENLFKWVGPISMERYVLFAPEGSSISVTTPDDLSGLIIGTVDGDASTQLLLDAGVEKSRIVSAATPSELIQKLQAGEIDLWAYPEYTGTYYMDQETGDSHLFTVVYRLSETGIYYALSQDIPDSYVESLQNSLDALQSGGDDCGTGQYEKILASYVPENTPTD